MRTLLALSLLVPLTASAQVVAPAPAAAVDPYDAAMGASQKLKDLASESLERLRAMPVEFAGVTKVLGYAGEVPNSHRIPDLAPTLAAKKAYWSAHARALGARLSVLQAEEAAQRQRVLSEGWRPGAFGDSLKHARAGFLLGAEKNAVAAALARVEAVLADIAADEKGADSGQALIDRKIVLFETLRR